MQGYPIYLSESQYKFLKCQHIGISPIDVVIVPSPFLTFNDKNAIWPIPEWLKNNFGWYLGGQITEKDLVSGLQYLANKNIIVLDPEMQREMIKLKQENERLRDLLNER